MTELPLPTTSSWPLTSLNFGHTSAVRLRLPPRGIIIAKDEIVQDTVYRRKIASILLPDEDNTNPQTLTVWQASAFWIPTLGVRATIAKSVTAYGRNQTRDEYCEVTEFRLADGGVRYGLAGAVHHYDELWIASGALTFDKSTVWTYIAMLLSVER